MKLYNGLAPFFTIITATRNAAATLPHLLESLVRQTCRDFELIIQDGASMDDTIAIAESYRDRLPALVIASEPDRGIYDAWNKALLRMRGEWALFLGADDTLYAPDVLYKVKKCLTDAEDNTHGKGKLFFASGGVVVMSPEGVPLRYISGRAKGAAEYLRNATIPSPFPGLFLHRSLFSTNAFDADFRIAGDYDFLCRTWKDDGAALRLPFLITAMSEGGISTKNMHAALCCKETLDAADKFFPNIWTRDQYVHYLRTRIISFLYTYLPGHAAAVHNMLRKLRGKSTLVDRKNPLLFFSPADVHVFIISYNRLGYLQKLISWLEKNKLENIIIVDNNSTYPPLLAYLDSLPYRVLRLEENLGHLAIWKCGAFTDLLSKEYFIVTDPDILPEEECPEDAIMQFYNRLMEYPQITKCGFGLRLDDIPAYYPLRESVMEIEKPYWANPLPDGSGYFAPIDTTFALYRPGIAVDDPKWLEGVRLTLPYAARHLPWYENPEASDDETLFYRDSTQAQSTFWTAVDPDSLKKENLALRVRIHELEHQMDLLSQSVGNQLIILIYKILRSIKKRLFGS